MAESILAEKDTAMRVILRNHLLALFRDREKCLGRRSFVAVIRQGGFRVVRPRQLKCCDVVIMETCLQPGDSASEQLVEQSLDKYVKWELRF